MNGFNKPGNPLLDAANNRKCLGQSLQNYNVQVDH